MFTVVLFACVINKFKKKLLERRCGGIQDDDNDDYGDLPVHVVRGKFIYI